MRSVFVLSVMVILIIVLGLNAMFFTYLVSTKQEYRNDKPTANPTARVGSAPAEVVTD